MTVNFTVVLRDVDPLVWPGLTLPVKSAQNKQSSESNMFYTTSDTMYIGIIGTDAVSERGWKWLFIKEATEEITAVYTKFNKLTFSLNSQSELLS